jgi:putative oxidoreductase
MNKILNFAYGPFAGNRASIGLLALRIVMGAAFIVHGFPKIQAPFSWMGPDASIPGFLQALAALAEFGGGMALIVGLFTPLASLGLIVTMLVALGTVLIPNGVPFVAKNGGPSSELAFVFLAASVLFLTVGPGRISLDALFFGGEISEEAKVTHTAIPIASPVQN